jgi:hypothetical protein
MATLRQMDQRLGKVVPTLPVKDQNRVLSAFERHGTEGLSAFPDDVRNMVLQAEREMKKR